MSSCYPLSLLTYYNHLSPISMTPDVLFLSGFPSKVCICSLLRALQVFFQLILFDFCVLIIFCKRCMKCSYSPRNFHNIPLTIALSDPIIHLSNLFWNKILRKLSKKELESNTMEAYYHWQLMEKIIIPASDISI
jgi:hypothetical protein